MRSDRRFLVHQWPDGCAVFDNLTGNTHALDPSTCSAFLAVESEDCGQEAIARAIRANHPEMSPADLDALIQSCTKRLQICGLLGSALPN